MSLQNSSGKAEHSKHPNLPCGSIIDAQGREVPITEDMIQHACAVLEKSRKEPAKSKKD
ncbi:PA1571 family protein [Pseudomonas sp. SDI]|uniref:PA1571 family protein n=1 Tax=Pseudomonas sp. SDI TaxID=2170734 RepID=UPI001403483C|nr:PA1571 family protein [Pseudomonas sp. SDI]